MSAAPVLPRLLAVPLAALVVAAGLAIAPTPAVADDPSTIVPAKIGIAFNGDSATARALTWHTAAAAGNDVRYLASPSEPADLTGAPAAVGTSEPGPAATGGVVHRVVLTGLAEGTRYWYQVGDATADVWSPIRSFETSDSDGETRFLVVGDSQGSTQSDYEVSAATFRAGLAQDPGTEFIVQAGDLVDNSNRADEWRWLFESDPSVWAENTVAAVSGNHDTAAGTFGAHFTNPVPSGGAQTTGDYYSFDVEGIHFTMLNTNDIVGNRLGDAQVAWMRGDIEAAQAAGAAWTVVVMHKGLQTVANHVTDADVVGMRAQLQPIFDELDVDLVIAGHDHTYARSETILAARPDADVFALTIDGTATDVNPAGITHLVPNASGTKFYSPRDAATLTANGVYPEVYAQPGLQMFTNVTVTATELSLLSYTVDAAAGTAPTLYDSYTIVKDPSADRAALVDAAIDSLPETITLDDADAIAEVRAAVDRLEAGERAALTRLERLEAAEAQLATLNVIPLTGSGTIADPYRIGTEAELRVFVDFAGRAALGYDDDAYLLTADILMTGELPMLQRFAGVLDGGGHTIYGLRPTADLSGADRTLAMIRELAAGGTIRDLGLSDVRISGDSASQSQTTGTRRAGLVAVNRGLVERVYVTGSISGAWRTGGIVADNAGTIRDTWFRGEVNASWETGGIVGRNGNEATNRLETSWADASVSTGNNNAGIVSGYGYRSHSTFVSLVALGGTVTGKSNLGRINGQENGGGPAYSNGLAAADILINGATTSGTRTTKQGESTSRSLLQQASTYTAIGWDFDEVWSMGAAGTPVLSGVPERTAADFGIGSDDSVETVVTSPDGRLVVRVSTDETATLRYEVERDGERIVGPSALGLTIDGQDWSSRVVLAEGEHYVGSDDYALLGAEAQVSAAHNGAVIPVLRGGESPLALDVRVFDSGLAIRYDLDDELAGAQVSAEWTTVDVDPSSVIHHQLTTSSTIDDMQNRWSSATFTALGSASITVLPTVELAAGGYLNIAEADVRDWPALALRTSATGSVSTAYWATDARDGTFRVAEATTRSPWRVITIADDLDALDDAALVTTLAEPVRDDLFADADEWVVPGRSLWMPYNGTGLLSTPASIRDAIDGAAELGIEYVLVEDMSNAQWGASTAEKFARLRELVDHGRELGVGVWLWSDYDHGNGIDAAFLAGIDDTSGFADRDSLQNPQFRDAYLDLLATTGIVGVKVDHIGDETETKVNLYADVDEAAAERRLMVIWHNPMAPTGLQRTFPNELVREAIRGVQSGYDATQNTIAPFTRLVAGAADYTPLTFSNGSLAGNATWAHQMASTIVYSAPYLQITEVASTMVDGGAHAETLGAFVRALPVTWSSSRVLKDAAVGSLAAVVRETEDGEYWIAAQAASGAGTHLEVPLDFLPAGVTYTADAYRDGARPWNVLRSVVEVDAGDTLTADLASGGGFVVRITLDDVEPPSGGGDAVIELRTEADLDLLRTNPTGGFRLMNDIEMTTPFEPVPLFRGELHGQGHSITGLVVGASPISGSRAMFLENQGEITGLSVVGASAHRTGGYVSADRVAVLVVTNRGTITQTSVTDSSVSGGWRSALIAAENYGTIADTYATGEVRGNWESAAVAAWNAADSSVERSWADAAVTADVQNVGVVAAYGYTGTRFVGLVAGGGSASSGNASGPTGRIGARENGTPTYVDGVALQSILLQGATVSGTATDKNGRSATEAELADAATYQAIGWDFDTVWTMSAELHRPVLRVAEQEQPPASVLVEFDSAGGSPIASIEVTGDTLPELPVPARDGYVFLGWSADTPTGPVPVAAGHAIAGLGDPIHLVAGWEATAPAIVRLELAPIGGAATARQGETLAFAVAGFDADDEPVSGVESLVVLSSDVPTDIVDGLAVTFPTASPHEITVSLIANPAVSSSVVVQVIPAAVIPGSGIPKPSPALQGTGSALPTAGLVLALIALLGGALLMVARRRRA